MKILVTGAKGQLGQEISRQMDADQQLILTDIDNLDITNQDKVRSVFQEVKPQAVIHCAAYTNVDGAEQDFDGAYKVNVIGSQNLASQCLEHHARMVYISTDYVFDGQGTRPYREFDPTNPLSVYGKTKLYGENIIREILGRHYIVRTSWLYGDGHNFVRTMLRLAKEKKQLRVVSDQIGSPTNSKDLVWAIRQLLLTDAYGVYHGSGNGACSWYEFAVKIFAFAGVNIAVEPITTGEYLLPATRPAYSVMENYMLKMAQGDPFRLWEEALEDYLCDLNS
ncbi:MAG TPA: dTDP-4-dehydrorhamnose reductase [Methylomusa anaerophila]|uniref:dTDP-4-dehydrorhamnose reductase n=1 Tax=Methylomusa anaerophila TaxID=1930071 RepID=A0A348AKM4_9FIRM|nr:dTDP-4-dehydrorhamnose reductase [Methylomusa anaerophila]BBB91622.1 dTDP-4-dehydrorhamnose reductase [Methylomusa anaerophila]HML89440.1 dTDP-4-dehydrorhamnose reductase [Methylomusa anaerophila]